MTTLLYKEEVYSIVGACMEVYNTLGYGFLEIVYKDAMGLEFFERGMEFLREEQYAINYKGTRLPHNFFADFTLFESIIVEVKANGEGIADEAMAQTLNYPKASGNRVGLVINFGKKGLEYKRLIF